MNIRSKYISSDSYSFIETNVNWQGNTLLKLEEIAFKPECASFLDEHQIFLGLIDTPLIFFENLGIENTCLDPDFLIFASRHHSETAHPAFLAHLTGNWSINTDFGGKAKRLSKASAVLLKSGFKSLKNQLIRNYFKEFQNFSLDIEVTHHGPTSLQQPLLFLELGSSKKEWEIKKAGELVSNAIIDTCFNYIDHKECINIGVGFGGTHYAPQFKRLIEDQNTAISFICPKYYIQELSKELIQQMIDNTIEKVNCFIIDWKGTNSQDKKHLMPLLEEFEIPIMKAKELRHDH